MYFLMGSVPARGKEGRKEFNNNTERFLPAPRKGEGKLKKRDCDNLVP